MHQDMFARYDYLYSGVGLCTIIIIVYYIYCQQLFYILSRLRSLSSEELINTIMQHWQSILNVFVLLEITNFHFGVRKVAKTYADLFMLLFYFFLHEFIPLLFAYVLIRSVRQYDHYDDCYFTQGLFLLRVFYPINSCPWVSTVFQSAMFFGAVTVVLINGMHRVSGMSIRKMVIIIYSCFYVLNFGVLSWRAMFMSDRRRFTPYNQQFYQYIFCYLHAILWVERYESKQRRPKPFKWWHKPSRFNYFLTYLLFDVVYQATFCTILTLVGFSSVSEKFIHSKPLLVLIDMCWVPIEVLGNQLLTDFLIYDKTFICYRVYRSGFLKEIGKRSQSIVIGHIVASHIVRQNAMSIQLGPNNIATMLLYLSGQFALVILFSYICELMYKYVLQLIDRTFFAKYGPGLLCR